MTDGSLELGVSHGLGFGFGFGWVERDTHPAGSCPCEGTNEQSRNVWTVGPRVFERPLASRVDIGQAEELIGNALGSGSELGSRVDG